MSDMFVVLMLFCKHCHNVYILCWNWLKCLTMQIFLNGVYFACFLKIYTLKISTIINRKSENG